MSTLLRALRNYSTTAASSSGCHGSPVMILKEMIDKHFSEAAAVTSPSPVSPVNNRINTAGIASHVRHVSLYTVSPVSPVNNRMNTAFLSVHRMARFARA